MILLRSSISSCSNMLSYPSPGHCTANSRTTLFIHTRPHRTTTKESRCQNSLHYPDIIPSVTKDPSVKDDIIPANPRNCLSGNTQDNARQSIGYCSQELLSKVHEERHPPRRLDMLDQAYCGCSGGRASRNNRTRDKGGMSLVLLSTRRHAGF